MSIENIRRACAAIGLPLPTERKATTYKFPGYPHCHTYEGLIRLAKRIQCVRCRSYVRKDLRENKRPDWSDYRPDDVGAEEQWLDLFVHWLQGCKTGHRPDIRKFEDEAPRKCKGGWWGTVGLPCTGFLPVRECHFCRHHVPPPADDNVFLHVGEPPCRFVEAYPVWTGETDNDCNHWEKKQ